MTIGRVTHDRTEASRYRRRMFNRIRSGWALTMKAWGVVRTNPGLAKLPLTGGAIALVVFLALGIPGALLIDVDNTGATIGGIVLLAVGAYLASYAVIYFNVALAAGADQALRDEEPDIRAAKRVARSRIGTIAGWALVSVVVSMAIGALRDRAGVAGTIVASIGGAIWSLVTFLVVPVLAFEGIGPISAMKRSASLIRDRWGQEITGNFVIGGVAGLITFFGIIVGVGGAVLFIGGSDAGADVIGAFLVLLGATVAIGGAVFGGATRGVFGVALYHYVAEDHIVAPFTATELAATARAK